MPNMKRTIKDSLFSYIFKEPEYTRKLFTRRILTSGKKILSWSRWPIF